MIFTLKNADFSASNIGTLSSWRIVKSLRGVTTDSNVVSVSKDASYSAVFYVNEGYTFNNAVVTMDGNDISSSLVWNANKTIGTLTISSVTGHIYISIVADALIGDGEDIIKQYTITYKYISESGQLLRVSTTEKVDEGTFKEFSIDNAPEIEEYKIKEVSPTSATISGNTTVSYIYEVIKAEGGGDNEGGEEGGGNDDLPTTETWYVDVAKYGGSSRAAASYAGFAYCDANTIAACIGVPINAFRMRVSTDGIFTYGKTNNTTYTELGTLNLEKSSEIAIYELDNIITLSEGERLVFGKNTDTGQFTYYAGGGASYPEGKFDVYVSESQPSGRANTAADLLSIDIGYVPDSASVTGITLNKTSADVSLGGTLQLVAHVLPEYATNQNVTWSASNSNCTVNSSGLVYGLTNGECIITATTEDGGFTASCTVTVTSTVWYLATADTSKINTGSETATASFMYANNEEIATYVGKPINLIRLAVYSAGTLSYGKTDGTTYSQLGTINLVNPSMLLQIYDIPEITLAEGENLWFQGKEDTGKFYYCSTSGTVGKFTYNVNQENPSGTNTSSSNLSIDIGYTNSYGEDIRVTGVELDKTKLSMSVGESIKLNAIIDPQNATNKNVTWTASNNNCTVVDGLVTRVAEGDCIITVTTEDGDFTASCTVTLSDKIWYVNAANQSALSNVSAVDSSSFAYCDNVTENAIDKPINIVRLAVANAGNLSYGKVSNNTKIELGEITLTKPSRNLQIYKIPRLILSEGEKLWFQDTGDTGLFYYQYDDSNGVGNFYSFVKLGSDIGKNHNPRNLSIDVGYDGTIYDENVVTGITLNETSKIMSVNETLTLTATLLPQNAINQNIIWTASNSNCTVVDGLVTTVAAGECTITATSADGGFTAACNLVILSDEEPEVWYVNHAADIPKIAPSVPGAASFAYNVDSVINACVGKPINAIRLAVAQAGTLAYGKVSETEYLQLGTITLSDPSTDLQTYIIPEITLAEGERLWIQGASDTGLFWYSNTSSSTVPNAAFNVRIKDSDKVGVVGSGNLPIDIGYVNSNKVALTDMTFGNDVLILDLNQSKQLNPKFTPSYATRNVTWSASNNNCTVVDGLVTRVAEGECIITATTEDGEFTASCRVSSTASATWYVDLTSSSTLSSTSNNTGGFAYTQDAINSACIGNPINLLRLAVGTEGVFSYGKTDGSTYTLLGKLNFTNPSKELQIFEIPEVTLAEGEKLVFGQPTDKGYFRYQAPTVANGNFINNVSASNPTGRAEYKGNLSIDIGYLNPDIN